MPKKALFSLSNLWRHYLQNNDALIYVIDSCDRERFDEARDELWGLLEQDELRHTCLLVYANKQDLPGAANPSQVTEALDLFKLKDRRWYVQACCAVGGGDGLVEGLEWVAKTIKENKKTRMY